jgi:RND family efflux transporter MFP subunit
MSIKKTVTIGGILLLLLVVLIFWFTRNGNEGSPQQTQDVTTEKPERKIKYWQAPMDPTYIRDKPGKSPMGMELIPVYEDEEEESDLGVIKINPVTVQNMGVRTKKASRGSLHVTIRTVGHITYDEKLVAHIHTKISGWLEKLFVDTTGEEVHKGQELLSIYSPELVTTQEEYLQALKYREKTSSSRFTEVARGGETLIKATRQRLLLMDIDPKQIEALEKRAEVQNNMILHSPTSGIVVEKHVLDGMKVNPGMQLYTIADISRVWVMASVYEYELPFLKVGQEAEITLPYEPGAKYKGHITFIYPYLSAKTRTVQVRMEFENSDLKLKPDMYADVVIKTKAIDDAVLVPSEAVIRTGSRNVVITALGRGKFLPKEVTIGPEGEGFVQIVSGLNEEETVVTSGQFLIDSESNLREAINKMLEAKKAASTVKEETSQHPAEHKAGEMKMEPR